MHGMRTWQESSATESTGVERPSLVNFNFAPDTEHSYICTHQPAISGMVWNIGHCSMARFPSTTLKRSCGIFACCEIENTG